uniref:Uncharacterized protein n=1 Tax=Aegilops tauschii TaxID=37682 RepID=M8CUB2_AEGTA
MAPPLSPKRRCCPDATVSLPDELIFNILSWAPLNSVCRFRCVCRVWRAVLSDPAFIATHRSRHAEPLLVVRSSQENPGRGYDLRLMDMDGNVVREMKGIGGMGSLSTSADDHVCITDYLSGRAHVIDLAKGEVVVDCPKPKSQLHHVFGFGRAEPSGKYKVETVPDGGGGGPPPAGISDGRSSPVAVDGTMYFLSSDSPSDDALLRLDLESEQWTKPLKGPMNTMVPLRWKMSGIVRITELNGCFCVVHLGAHMTIWLMTESENEKWVKAYTIPVDPSTKYCMPLRVTCDGGKLIFFSSCYGQGSELRVYDPSTETCTTRWALGCRGDTVRLCNLQLGHFVRP